MYIEPGTGAIEQPHKDQDYSYDDYVAMAGPLEIDWDKGFDIRNELGADIKIKNQKHSLSCVGQGWSYQVWIYQILELMEKWQLDLGDLWDDLYNQHSDEVYEVSAKAVYSQIALANGGAYIGRGGELLVDWGALSEILVPSKYGDDDTDEKFMRDLSWQSKTMTQLAKTLKGKDYRIIRAKDNLNLYARAILENKGVVGGVKGQNGHGWGYSERPTPPGNPDGDIWRHCLWFGAYGTDEYGKFIATPNSWGKKKWNEDMEWYKGAPPGHGWQKLYVNYVQPQWMFDPWTYTDKPNPQVNQDPMDNEFVKIIKDENSSAVGFWIPMTSPEALKTMALAYNKEVHKKEDGSIDFEKSIEGTLNLKQ